MRFARRHPAGEFPFLSRQSRHNRRLRRTGALITRCAAGNERGSDAGVTKILSEALPVEEHVAQVTREHLAAPRGLGMYRFRVGDPAAERLA